MASEQVHPAPSVGPKRYVLLLLKSFSAFDLISVIESLKEANRKDATKLYEWALLSENGKPCTASTGMAINVDDALITLDRRDTLIVLGGEEFISASTLRVLAWLQRQARFGLTIGGISSATFALAKAGILRESEIVTHWSFRSSMQETLSEFDVICSIFSMREKRFTCAGGAATLDLMLQLISREQGAEVATWVADNMVCSLPRTGAYEQRISQATRIEERNTKVFEAIQIMHNALEIPISLPVIAKDVGISIRQLERLFSKYLRATPMAYYMKLRLERARSLLIQTDMKIIEVAIASGYDSASQFSKLYKKQFGITPHQERPAVQPAI
jgi:transcriptional regulator GlxA family with amidase domain